MAKRTPPPQDPPPSDAVRLELEALRAMLNLPPDAPEPDEAPADTRNPPFTTPPTNPEG